MHAIRAIRYCPTYMHKPIVNRIDTIISDMPKSATKSTMSGNATMTNRGSWFTPVGWTMAVGTDSIYWTSTAVRSIRSSNRMSNTKTPWRELLSKRMDTNSRTPPFSTTCACLNCAKSRRANAMGWRRQPAVEVGRNEMLQIYCWWKPTTGRWMPITITMRADQHTMFQRI